MRRAMVVLILMTLSTAVPAQAERIAAIDFIFATSDGDAFFGDHFNNGALEPFWEVVNGAPGPEAGTTLDLNAGDLIVTPLDYDEKEELVVAALFDVGGMNPGDLAAVVLYGETRTDFVALIFGNGAAFAGDDTGAVLGITNYMADQAAIELRYRTDGTFRAAISGFAAFDGDPGDFGGVTEVGLLAIPEPATLALLGVGATFAGWRHRRT